MCKSMVATPTRKSNKCGTHAAHTRFIPNLPVKSGLHLLLFAENMQEQIANVMSKIWVLTCAFGKA